MTLKQEQHICAVIGDTLQKHYPGHIWLVNAEQGRVNIFLGMVSGKWGFRINIVDLDVEGRKIIMAGGELLERFNLSRAMRKAQVSIEMAELKRDFTGEAVHA